MPNIKSAKKRMKTSRVRAARNREARSRLRTAIKKVRNAEDHDAAQAAFRDVQGMLDRAAQKHLMHANKAGRIKAQLQRHVDSLA